MKSETPYNGLYCDNRMGGWPKYYLGHKPANADMRIPDEYLDGVVFLCVRKTAKSGLEEIDYFIGTAFLISEPTSFEGQRIFYLVTAKHLIEEWTKAGYDISARFNTKDGQSITVKIGNYWHFSDNPAVDVAVMSIPVAVIPDLKLNAIPIENFATDEVIERERIGIGDDVFAIGLFNQKWGHARNAPVMRTGIIASMPQEPLEKLLPNGEVGSRSAYLIEIRSIGGLSGSPVFANLPYWRPGPNMFESMVGLGDLKLRWTMHLLGLISGHWELEKQDSVADSLTDAAPRSEEIDSLNTGIAIVSPIHEVVKILASDAVMEMKKKAEIAYIEQFQPTDDSGSEIP
ncbi:MAG: hypothetical protein QOG23_1367 [Blastocatellia bacterium]|jgi:hypothetical protein|nr:hypothetical protein [Blastocatellia bacterium]